MNNETLTQIAQMRDALQEEQISLRKTLAETQRKIAENEEDINACAHLLARFAYIDKENDAVQVEPSSYTIAE